MLHSNNHTGGPLIRHRLRRAAHLRDVQDVRRNHLPVDAAVQLEEVLRDRLQTPGRGSDRAGGAPAAQRLEVSRDGDYLSRDGVLPDGGKQTMVSRTVARVATN